MGSGSKAGSGENTGTSKLAKDSTTRPDHPASNEAELLAMRNALKDVWGHLPPKLREQMQSGSFAFEQFLPKYEHLIEAYYTRLAEERKE